MHLIGYCPIVGGSCNKAEHEVTTQKNTFFVAEPFKPPGERKRREDVIRIALKEVLGGDFCEEDLKVADKDPKEAIFCDICRMIQSASYGIADISGLNPNVLLELGMILSLGKPLSVLFKKSEEASLRENLPSDIVWKRVIPYEEFIDLHEELVKHIQNRPVLPLEISSVTEMKKVIAEEDPELAKNVENSLKESLKKTLDEFERLMNKAKLSGEISDKKVEVEPSVGRKLDEIFEKVKQVEKLVGFPKDAQSALLKANWHVNKEDYQNAIDLYDWALNLEPDSNAAWNNKGAALERLGRFEEAIKCYEEALRIRPHYYMYLNNKGSALNNLGRYEEAIECFKATLKTEPDNIDTLPNLSEAQIALGKTTEALESIARAFAVAKDPRNKAVLLLLSSLAYLLQENNEKAESEISKLTNLIKESGSAAVCPHYDFSLIEKKIIEKLPSAEKTRLLLLVALLKGERKTL